MFFKNENFALNGTRALPEDFESTNDLIKKYDMSINGTNDVGYNSYDEFNSKEEDKPNTLHSNYVCVGFVSKDKGKEKEKYNSKPKQNLWLNFTTLNPVNMIILLLNSKLLRTLGKQKEMTQEIMVPRKQIIYVADILSSASETLVMVPELWLLATHKEKKAYVPNRGT